MKKTRLIAALLAATIITGSIPVQAQEEPQKIGRVRKQWNESLDRFRRCVQLKCTRWEALKAARDLAIMAAVVVGVVYAGKKGIEKGMVRLPRVPVPENTEATILEDFTTRGTLTRVNQGDRVKIGRFVKPGTYEYLMEPEILTAFPEGFYHATWYPKWGGSKHVWLARDEFEVVEPEEEAGEVKQ